MKKPVAAFFSLFIVFSLSSCAHNSPVPERDSDIAVLEKKLAETNEKLDEMVRRVSELQLMVDTQQRSLLDLKADEEKPISAPEAPVAPDLPLAPATAAVHPPEPDALYTKAFGLFKNREYQAATELFDAFAARYPYENLADNALYWAGECRYALKDYAGAVASFKSVLKSYPNGNKVPDSLLKLGVSYLALGDETNGKDYLKKVIKNYPFSPAALKAEEKLKLLTTR